MLIAFVIWNASKAWLCDPDSQGHAIWHLLGAVSANYLYRYNASEVVTERHEEPNLSVCQTEPDLLTDGPVRWGIWQT